MAVERRLTELAMFTREAAETSVAAATGLMRALLDRAREYAATPMLGYTHLQRAQPVYLGHHLLAYFWVLDRDRRRFAYARREAGRLPLMPQKKNPDAAELLRGKAPCVVAHLVALHGVIHSLPLTYNKDLQEDKEHLFDAVDTIELSLAAATGMVAGARFDAERMREAASDELIAATDIADLLVKLGMPFREAHGVVAGLVREVVESGRSLSDLNSDELAAQSTLLAEHEAEFREVLESSSWLESKVSEGGTSSVRLAEQLALAERALDADPFL